MGSFMIIKSALMLSKCRCACRNFSIASWYLKAIFLTCVGIYKLQLTDTVTKNISAGRYVYDVMITLADSTVEVVQKGIVTVNPRVTQL